MIDRDRTGTFEKRIFHTSGLDARVPERILNAVWMSSQRLMMLGGQKRNSAFGAESWKIDTRKYS
jgi:hypothetical protein